MGRYFIMSNMKDFAVVSEANKRKVLEDAYFLDIISEFEIFCGVYDGHIGSFAAEYARDNIYKMFFEQLSQGKNELEAFKNAYEKVSENLLLQESGTVAANFYLRDSKMFYANSGDARLVIVGEYGARQLTEDHRIDNPEERERIEKNGGIIMPPYVYKGGIGLEPTRTLGDAYFKDIGVICTPDLGFYTLDNNDKWILIGTDGLFDILDNDVIAELIKDAQNAKIASTILKKEVLFRGGDNVTFVLIKISNDNNFENNGLGDYWYA